METLSKQVWNDGKEGCHDMYYDDDVKEFVSEVLRINSTAHSRHQKDVLIKRAAGYKLT